MRLLDTGLFYKDLTERGLPIGLVQIVPQTSSELRNTHYPYYEKFVQILWMSEPPLGFESTIASVLSKHLDVECKPNSLINSGQKFQAFAEPLTTMTEDEARFDFTEKISDSIIPIINEAMSGGACLRKVRVDIPGYPLQEYLHGHESFLLLMEEVLSKEPALYPALENNLTIHFGSNGSQGFSLRSIAVWILKRALQTKNASAAVSWFNDCLLTRNLIVQEVVCIDGIEVKERHELADRVFIVPSKDLEGLSAYKQLFEHQILSFLETRRNPTAALISEYQIPQFTRADSNFLHPQPRNFNLYLDLLTIFGPLAASPIVHFIEVISKTFPTMGCGCNPSYSRPSSYSLPFHPDLSSFCDLYKSFSDLDKRTQKQVVIALERLRSSLQQSSTVNQALDLGIALESILLSGKSDDGTSGELTYRLASRGAWLLGQTSAQRLYIFEKLKAVYKLRSKASHEGAVANITKGVHKGEEPVLTKYILQDGAGLCCKAIRQVIKYGQIPDWTNLTLGKQLPE